MNEYANDEIWTHYKRNGDTASCKICLKNIKCSSSSTTGLHRHLIAVHKKKRKFTENFMESTSSSKKIKTIDEFLTKRSTNLDYTVSKLAAKDGIPINAICKSEFIRNSFYSQGLSLPKQPSDIMRLIYNFYEYKKQELIAKINQMKANGEKFSLSIDEWTSYRNRRYINVHLNFQDSGESENLGLVRINGSCPAEKALELVNLQIKSFELDFETDVVSTTSDGASVMVKFGKLSSAHQQLCYNHAIHLSVVSCFYKKKSSDTFNDVSSSDSFISDEEFDKDDIHFEPDSDCNQESVLENKYEVIKKIRTIVKVFKNSPVRNGILQDHIKNLMNTELQLILDCKTRWNTVESMIKRFLKIKIPVFKSLEDLNLKHLWISAIDEKEAIDILQVLKPTRLAVEALSRHDTNILTGEGILKFLFKTLKDNNSDISTAFLKDLQYQISKRRDITLISLITFLQDPSCLHSQSPEDELILFKLSTKNEILKKAKTILTRLFPIGETENKNSDASENDSNGEDDEILTIEGNTNEQEESHLKKMLEASIQEILKPKSKENFKDYRSLLKEFNIYESTGILTNNFQKLKGALSTIKPTSTQNERNFSISNNFASKNRGRMSDKSLNCLCFLKAQFLKEK